MSLTDVGISVPANWRRTSDPGCGVLMAAVATGGAPHGFRPCVRLRCVPTPGRAATWPDQSSADLRATCVDFALEDEDDYELAGRWVGYRRYAHRLHGADVLCEEWTWWVDGLGLVLTCSVAREEYADYCDVFEAIAETVEPPA